MLAQNDSSLVCFLYPPELPFPPRLYSAHKINPSIMKNKMKRSPIFKRTPKYWYRLLVLFPTGSYIYYVFCIESNVKWEQYDIIMKPLAPF